MFDERDENIICKTEIRSHNIILIMQSIHRLRSVVHAVVMPSVVLLGIER